MRDLFRRVTVAAGAVVVLLGLLAGAASAANAPVVLIWSPTTSTGTYSYGTLIVGQTASQTFTLLNSGGANTSALTITLTGPSTFTKIGDACTGAKLKPDKSCDVIVRYAAATASQNDSATLTAASGKPSATVSLALNGTSGKASPVIATTPSAGGTVGSTAVTDTATLSGGDHPTGTITFSLYGPSTTASCSGTPVDTGQAPVSGGGSYSSPSFTAAQGGTYWWTASYSGDVNNNAVSSGCGDESVAISKASPAIATAPSGGVTVGTAVTDTATLTGGDNPTGTITFNLYGPSTTASCSGTPVDTGQAPVIVNTEQGGGSSYSSPSFTPAQAGTYWWTASYSGDVNNNAVSSGCGDESLAISKTSPVIVTTPSAGGDKAATANDTATLSDAYNPTGTIEFRLYGPSTTANCSGTPVFDEAVTVSGYPSTSSWAVPTQAGTYWWTASYSGDVNNNAVSSGCGEKSVTLNPAAHVYWTNRLADDVSPGGTIAGVNLDGTGLNVLVTGQPNLWGVAVDSSHIYWATTPGTPGATGSIREANLDGTGVTTLVTGQDFPFGVAVDGSHIYWTNYNGGTIMEANLDGTDVTTLVTGQPNPQGVAVDSSHIYWVNGESSSGAIMEANLDGTDVTTLVTGQDFPSGVAVDSSHIYWTSASGIFEANLDGTNQQTIVNGSNGVGIASDGTYLYYPLFGNSSHEGTIYQDDLQNDSASASGDLFGLEYGYISGVVSYPWGVAVGRQ